MRQNRDHLDSAEILALLEGRPLAADAREHIDGCPECRGQVDDTQRTLAYLPLAEPERDEPHPSTDVLMALAHKALSSGRVKEVNRHLRHCSACLARFERLRGAGEPPADPARSREAMADTAQRLREMTPPRERRLGGRLAIRWLEDAARFVFGLDRGEPAFQRLRADYLETTIQAMQHAEADAAPPPHPASSRARLLRKMAPQDSSAGPPESPRPPQPPTPPAPEPVVLEAEPFVIKIGPVGSLKEAALRIILLHMDTGEPADGVRVVLASETRSSHDGTTDRQGEVHLPLPRGRSMLRIGERRAYRLEIRFSD